MLPPEERRLAELNLTTLDLEYSIIRIKIRWLMILVILNLPLRFIFYL
jgi:hypothetical protein